MSNNVECQAVEQDWFLPECWELNGEQCLHWATTWEKGGMWYNQMKRFFTQLRIRTAYKDGRSAYILLDEMRLSLDLLALGLCMDAASRAYRLAYRKANKSNDALIKVALMDAERAAARAFSERKEQLRGQVNGNANREIGK